MKKTIIALGIAAAMIATTAVSARELRLGPAAPPAHPAHTPLYSSLVEFLPEETNGALTGLMLGTEVVNIGGMKSALQSSIAEIGNFLPLYYPADVPNTALMGDLAFLGKNSHAMGAAMTEYVVTCEECIAEFTKLGVVFGGSGSSDPYVLLTTKPIRSAADLKGVRLRSGGSPFARWAEYVGATGVGIPVSGTFESISQGTIDGSMASVNDLVAYRLVDLIKYVTVLQLGTYHATSNFTIAGDTWKALSIEERKGLIRAANRANPMFTQAWGYERPVDARAQGVAAGIEFITPDQDLIDLTAKFVEQDIQALVKIAAEQYGIPDAAEKIARFRALVEKWDDIVTELGNDTKAIAQATQTEIWDKVNYETYGL